MLPVDADQSKEEEDVLAFYWSGLGAVPSVAQEIPTILPKRTYIHHISYNLNARTPTILVITSTHVHPYESEQLEPASSCLVPSVIS